MSFRHLALIFFTCCAMAAATPPCAVTPGAAGVPIRQAREEWQTARTLVAADDGWRQWLQQESQRLGSWMAETRDREDLVAGWIHDYQDASSGAFRSWSPAASCDTPSLPGRARAACIALQRHHHIRMMQTAARLATLTGERGPAEWAAAQFDMYVRLHARQAGAGRPALFEQGLDVANVVPALADAARLLRPLTGSARADGWCADLLRPLAATLAASQRKVHNIAVWHASAVAIVGMECADDALLRQALSGPWSLAQLLATGVSADGFWFELSLGYQNYVAQALHEALLAAALRGRGDAFVPLHRYLHALLASPLQVQFRNGEGPTINDSNRHPAIPDAAVLRSVRRIAPTAAGLRAAHAAKDWDALLDPPEPAPTETAPPAAEGGRHIPGLKSLLLRSGSWQALLRAGQDAPFHAHQDTLSYELKHADSWVLRNSATPAYGSEMHRRYYKLALSHNTPLVNDLGVSNWFAQAHALDADESSIAASVKSFQHGVGVRRQLSAGGPVFSDRIEFRAQAGGTQRFGAIYHTDCTLASAPLPSAPLPLPAGAGFEYLRASASWRSTDAWSASLDCGGRNFVLRLQASSPFTLSRSSAPALFPARRRSALLVDMPAAGDGWILLQLEAPPAMARRAEP